MSRTRLTALFAVLLVAIGLVAAGCGGGGNSTGGETAADSGLPTGRYLEAESGALSGGFRVEDDPTASAQRYLAPPDAVSSDDVPGTARAQYSFPIERAGDYWIWGRIRSPGTDNNRFWFQLDGDAWRKWRISTGATLQSIIYFMARSRSFRMSSAPVRRR